MIRGVVVLLLLAVVEVVLLLFWVSVTAVPVVSHSARHWLCERLTRQCMQRLDSSGASEIR